MASNPDHRLRLVGVAALIGLTSSVAAIEVGPPVLVSHTPDGQPTGGICYGPRLSPTGRFTGFSCMAFDVIYGEPGVGDALLHDGETGVITGLSYTDQGEWGYCEGTELGTCSSASTAVSDDGSLAVLNSSAPLTEDSPHPTPDHGFPNVYLRDVVNQATTWLTPPMPPYPTYNTPRAMDASMERHEILINAQNNYTGNPDTNGDTPDVFVMNWETGAVELISATPNGQQGEGAGSTGALSPDGRYVVFGTTASDLTDDNPQGLRNLFLRDRVLRTTRRLTFPWNGGEFTSQPNIQPNVHMTTDNRYVFFASSGQEFAPDSDPNVPLAVYEIDLQTGQTRLISRGVNDEPLNASAFGASFSHDGRYMAFETTATNVSEDPGLLPAVFVRDRLTGETVNVSAALGDPPHTLPGHVTLSADGSNVAFSWPQWNVTYPTLLDNQQIYTVRLRGDPPPLEAIALPVVSRSALVLLALLLSMAALLGAKATK